MCIFKKREKTEETGVSVPLYALSTEVKDDFSYDGESEKEAGFKGLADALGVTEEKIKNDCKYHLIRKITSGIGDLTVRFSPTDEEMNLKAGFLTDFGVGEFCVAPLYIKRFMKKKGKPNDKLSVIVDFPFGETSFSAKKSEIKNCVSHGVKEITAVLPSSILKENPKELKKEIRSLGKIRSAKVFAAIPAENTDAAGIKNFLKAVARSGIYGSAFIFGKTDEKSFKEAETAIMKNKGAKPVKIIAEVTSAKVAYRLLAGGAYRVVTPYAEDICRELVAAAGFKSK